MSLSLPIEIESFLHQHLGRVWEAEPLQGDASVRGYYRVRSGDGRTFMLAYYPESVRHDIGRFLLAHGAIQASSRIPGVVLEGPGTILQDDVGDETLFQLLHTEREQAIPYYKAAIDLIVEFQSSPPQAAEVNPPFDAEKFFQELEMTNEFYVEHLMGIGDRAISSRLLELFARLAEKLTSHPYVLCHRDYHGQNLHILDGTLYMIDFQDLRMGPDTYDLSSLLRDRGVWQILGSETERALVGYYGASVGSGESLDHRYYETLLQRSIKAIGTFARQSITRGRDHYLDFIPSTLESVRECTDHLEEFRELAVVFPMNYPGNPTVRRGA